MLNAEPKVVLITGAAGGLGNLVTSAFLNAGATVIGAARSIADADFPHPRFSAMPCELSSGRDANDLVGAVVSHWGRVDGLVHVIGGFAGGQTVAETDDATIERMLDINFRCGFWLLRAVLPHMRAQGSGRIAAVGSKAAVEPQALVGAYAASKAALLSLVRTVALENAGNGISANIVLPGTMDTPGNRAGNPGADFLKWVQPGQVASLLVHLILGDSSNINGAVIPIYGAGL